MISTKLITFSVYEAQEDWRGGFKYLPKLCLRHQSWFVCNATRHFEPHPISSKCSLLPSTDLHKVGLLPLPHPEKKSLNLHKKVCYTTADGRRPKPQCRDVSYDEMLIRRRLMTPENRLSIQSLWEPKNQFCDHVIIKLWSQTEWDTSMTNETKPKARPLPTLGGAE